MALHSRTLRKATYVRSLILKQQYEVSFYSYLYLADVENRCRDRISLNQSLDQIITSYMLNLHKGLSNL